MNFLAPEVTDVTGMVNMEAEGLEKALGISLTKNTDMAKRVRQYSKDEISTDSADGIGVVYLGNRQVGLHIDDRKYGMFGLCIGYSEISVHKKITYEYESFSDVISDGMQSFTDVTYFYNKKRNDCVVVIYNNYSHRVAALTYYNDLNKMTERLSKVR